MLRDADVSRVVSHALRHAPWLYELELDDEGWAPVEQLLLALREKGGDWTSLDRRTLERVVVTATKRRHELDGARIRALYGHSLPARIRREPALPPARLFHGTAPETWPVIETEGLQPMGRQFVHLSVERETALLVGGRKSASPVVVTVRAAEAAVAGVSFYEANELVWLADCVPAAFLDLVV
jgi:putative RNA 2'-phosphotransferase